MTIDLMALAQQANEAHIDVDLSIGAVRVYHVPDAVLLAGNTAFSEPDIPMVTMQLTQGHTQERLAKKGDKEYEAWRKEIAEMREYQFELRQAKGFIYALRDIDWSKIDLSTPPSDLATIVFNGNWPKEELLRKKIWLDFTVLRVRADKELVLEAIDKLNETYEPTEEGIDEVKKNSE